MGVSISGVLSLGVAGLICALVLRTFKSMRCCANIDCKDVASVGLGALFCRKSKLSIRPLLFTFCKAPLDVEESVLPLDTGLVEPDPVVGLNGALPS